MVRSALSHRGLLRYRASPMSDETDRAADGDAAPDGLPIADTTSERGTKTSAGSRPWTPAAAMEPVPPLAPPPKRPGAGATLVPGPPAAEARDGLGAVARVVVVALIVAVLVALLVVAGR
jgi:hypothetical protein